jgi:hypothetical protein
MAITNLYFLKMCDVHSGFMQASGGLGRSAPSPGTAGTPNFENVSTPPMPYANSPRSGTNMMNTPSPQQHLTPQQQRQKMMQASQQQQQLLSQQQQQQLRPTVAGMLAQVRQIFLLVLNKLFHACGSGSMLYIFLAYFYAFLF